MKRSDLTIVLFLVVVLTMEINFIFGVSADNAQDEVTEGPNLDASTTLVPILSNDDFVNALRRFKQSYEQGFGFDKKKLDELKELLTRTIPHTTFATLKQEEVKGIDACKRKS
uniref:Uncharacterized protein n=1 Tax=Glossina brevipalpis TaxID=37001 RepID=A0A1A9WU26_9MUSC